MNRHLGQLEDQSPGVPYQTASHLDQFDLHTPQRPVLDRLGQTQPAKEVPKVVRQNEQRQTHPVGHEPMARQPSPVQGVLPFFDPLLASLYHCRNALPAVMFVTMKPTRGNSRPPPPHGPNSQHDTKSRRRSFDRSISSGAISYAAFVARQRMATLLQVLIDVRLGECGVGAKVAHSLSAYRDRTGSSTCLHSCALCTFPARSLAPSSPNWLNTNKG